jgi:hypothetical protein
VLASNPLRIACIIGTNVRRWKRSIKVAGLRRRNAAGNDDDTDDDVVTAVAATADDDDNEDDDADIATTAPSVSVVSLAFAASALTTLLSSAVASSVCVSSYNVDNARRWQCISASIRYWHESVTLHNDMK